MWKWVQYSIRIECLLFRTPLQLDLIDWNIQSRFQVDWTCWVKPERAFVATAVDVVVVFIGDGGGAVSASINNKNDSGNASADFSIGRRRLIDRAM